METDWQAETGSAAYYSIRFAPATNQAALRLIFAWQRMLHSILAQATDPGVSRLKLDWWHQELQQSQQGNSQHPLSLQLQAILNRPGILELLQTMLLATDRDLQRHSPPSAAEWYAHCDQCGESFSQLLVLASDGSTQDYTSITGLGRHIEIVQRICKPSAIDEQFHLPLPCVDAEQLLAPARKQAAQVMQNCRPTSSTVAIQCLAAQYLALDNKQYRQGKRSQKDQCTDMLPISRFWHAWRIRQNVVNVQNDL